MADLIADKTQKSATRRRTTGSPTDARTAGAGTDALTRLEDLKPDPVNRRTHNSITIERAAPTSFREVAISERLRAYVILAGNGVTQAAAEAGITKLRIIDAAGDELIAVRRSGLTDPQKRALAL